MKEWFKARNIWGAAILSLSDAEAGRLAKALWAYTMGGEEQNLSGAEKGIFAMIQMTLRQDEIRDADISEKRSRATDSIRKHKQLTDIKTDQLISNDIKSNQMISIDDNKNKNKNIEQEKEISLKRDKEKALADKFDRFWSAYPRHVDKKKAETAFKAINPDDELLDRMLKSIEKQKASTQWQEERFIPHPTTWLHGKRWEDEVQTSQQPARKIVSVPAQQYEQRKYDNSDPIDFYKRMEAMQ